MPKNTNDERADMIARVAKLAPSLREAGVTSLAIGELSFTLLPAAPSGELEAPTAAAASHIDPMKDPSTYPGGRLPGFTRPKKATT